MRRPPVGQIASNRSSPHRKNIPLYRNSELSYPSRQPGPTKGRVAIVTRRGPGSGGRGFRWREGLLQGGSLELVSDEHRARRRRQSAYGKSVWSWLSLLQSSLAEVRPSQPARSHCQFARRRRQERIRLRGEHTIICQTIAWGGPGCFRLHLSLPCAYVCISSAQGSWVPAGIRSFPRPLAREEGEKAARARAFRAARARVCVCWSFEPNPPSPGPTPQAQAQAQSVSRCSHPFHRWADGGRTGGPIPAAHSRPTHQSDEERRNPQPDLGILPQGRHGGVDLRPSGRE